jgi:hypothetical protein
VFPKMGYIKKRKEKITVLSCTPDDALIPENIK